MKLSILFCTSLIIFFILLQETNSAQKVVDFKAFDEKLKSIAASPFSRQRVKYIYFNVNKKKVGSVAYFSQMLESFLMTLNIRGTVYNLEDKLLMAMVNSDAEVDTDFLMKHFEGAFHSVQVRYPS